MKNKKFGFKTNKKVIICNALIITCILFLSVGFSAFQNNVHIKDLAATVRIDEDIRISGINILSAYDGTSFYEDYNVSNIVSKVNLNSADSYIIYNVDVYNLGNVLMGIKNININKENLKVEVLNYNLKTKLCDEGIECKLGSKKTLQLKVSYKEGYYDPSNTNFDFKVDFDFQRIYNISYVNINSKDSVSEIINGDTLNVNIENKENAILRVNMNNRILSSNEFSYNGNTLVIPNVSGNLKIYFDYYHYTCKRATSLHTEECFGVYCSGMGYKLDGSKGTTTITYGSLGSSGTLTTGDAFDCDVNGDGVYNSETERFYYLNNLSENSDIATLIYYNNVSKGQPNNNQFYQYYTTAENWHGPLNAMEQLPTTSQWSNVKLFNTSRKLVDEYGNSSTKDGHEYPKTLDYSKYAARLLTLSEVKKLVNFYVPSWKNGELDNHLYLAENTSFSKKDNSKFDGYWLETPRNTMSSYGWMIYATARRVHSVEVQRTDVLIGVRPVIEVPISKIDY